MRYVRRNDWVFVMDNGYGPHIHEAPWSAVLNALKCMVGRNYLPRRAHADLLRDLYRRDLDAVEVQILKQNGLIDDAYRLTCAGRLLYMRPSP